MVLTQQLGGGCGTVVRGRWPRCDELPGSAASLSLAPMGMPALDERKPSVVAPAAGSHEEDEWFMEKPKHRLEVDTALIERFNPEGRGAALLKTM